MTPVDFEDNILLADVSGNDSYSNIGNVFFLGHINTKWPQTVNTQYSQKTTQNVSLTSFEHI